MTIERVMEYANMHRLLITLDDATGLYHWSVCCLEDGEHYRLGESTAPVSLRRALIQGRRELAVWSNNYEAWFA